MASLTLSPCEMLALRSGVLSLAPRFELNEREKANAAFAKSKKKLLNIINERVDTPLGRIATKRSLEKKIKACEHYDDILLAIKSIFLLRGPLIRDKYEGIGLLVQAVYAAVSHEASRYKFEEEYNEIISVAAYCCLIVEGPEGYELPNPAPAGVIKALARVPVFADLATDERVH